MANCTRVTSQEFGINVSNREIRNDSGFECRTIFVVRQFITLSKGQLSSFIADAQEHFVGPADVNFLADIDVNHGQMVGLFRLVDALNEAETKLHRRVAEIDCCLTPVILAGGDGIYAFNFAVVKSYHQGSALSIGKPE